jgi:hypothetical protein
MRQRAPVAGAVSAAFSPMLVTSAALIVLPQSRRPRSVRLIGWVSGPPHRHADRRLRARQQQAEDRNGACQPFRRVRDLIAGYSLASRTAIPARCGHGLAS